MENGLRRPYFFRVIVALAATVVVLVGLRLGAPILNPILFAVVLSLLFSPVYSWLLRRGLPAPLALLGMLVLLTALLERVLQATSAAGSGTFRKQLLTSC